MKKIFILLIIIFFIVNLFYFPLKFLNVNKIQFVLEYSYKNGLVKYNDYSLKKLFFYNSINKFSIFRKNFKKILTYVLGEDEDFFEGKDFYIIKNKYNVTFYNKLNSASFELKTNKNILTSKDSNNIIFAATNNFEISVYRFDKINSNIIKIFDETFNDIWNNIKFNDFAIAISFLDGTFFYRNLIDGKEFLNKFDDSKYNVGYDIDITENGDYFGIVEGFEPQYFYIFSKDGKQCFEYLKTSESRNVFVFSPIKNYFWFKNGKWFYIVNKNNKKFEIENKIPLKGDLITYDANNNNIVVSSEFNNDFVITVYNIIIKKYYQFSFGEPVYKIVALSDNQHFILYNQDKFWLIKIK